MKREIATSLLLCLLAGTSFAGEIQSSELAPPAQKSAPDELTSLIRKSLTDQAPAQATPAATPRVTPSATPPVSDYDLDVQLYSSELWIEGLPETQSLSLDVLAQKSRSYSVSSPSNGTLPTSVALNRGGWTANLGAKVEAANGPITVIPAEAYYGNLNPSGGTGALTGRLEYDVSTWQFYGGTNRALVANSDGTLAVNSTLLGGTFYRLPDTIYGGKIGTGFEVNPVGDAKTRLEYRQIFGSTEGFVAAERTVPFQQHLAPDTSGVNALKAGINRKF